MTNSPRQARAGLPSFEKRLENEEEVLDTLLGALAKNQLDEHLWGELHDAAVRDDRVSELAFAYESIASGRKLRTYLPMVQAELFFRAATFFGDVLGDEFGSTNYLERALQAQAGHAGAFERIDAQLTRTDENKKLAELCVQTAAHRQRPEQLVLLRRAAVLFERAGLEDKAIETYQQLVRLEPSDEGLRDALEARYVRANRFRDVARMFEQALGAEPAPEPADGAKIRAKLIDVFANLLKEPERAMPHVEALVEHDPTHVEARRVATRLLESKGLAARAAAALAVGAATTAERAHYLAIELEHTRGPKRRDVLRRIGVLKQDELGDVQGAFEAFEQALGIDPGDDDLRRRYVMIGIQLKGPLEVAKTFARVSTVAKDAGIRSRITAEMGDLLLKGGDVKRARATLAGVVNGANADPTAALVAARALAGVYESERDVKNLVEVLARIGETSPDEEERQRANERVAELSGQSGDVERAIAAWRRLVDTPAKPRALAALEPLYEQRGDWIDLSFVLEERAKDTDDRSLARSLSFRAAHVLTTQAGDTASASEAWRQLVETYGPSRDVFEQWIPVLEAERQYPELARALATDAELASLPERPPVLARLGQLHLTRTRDYGAAIQAFADALTIDPEEKTSRSTLEKLLLTTEHRLAAAAVLEPIYRAEGNAQGLLRVLDIKAGALPSVQERLAALEEASDVATRVSREKAVEIVSRGLAEAVAADEPVAAWLERFDRAAEGLDKKRRAALLGKALGERPIESPDLLLVAKRVGEENVACGDVAAALAAYRRALAYEPSSAELLGKVDELLREQGNPEERVALYRAALEQGPEPPRKKQLLHSIGSVERYELANPEGAILAYTRAIKDDPSDRDAHAALVELHTETGDWSALIDRLESHLAVCTLPEETRATRAQLAKVTAEQGQRERALVHAEALLADAGALGPELDLVEHVAVSLDDGRLLHAVLERRAREAEDPRVQVQCYERLATLADAPEAAANQLRKAAAVATSMGDDALTIAVLERLRSIAERDLAATTQLAELLERAERWDRLPELYAVVLSLTDDVTERVRLLRRLAQVHADHLSDLARAFEATERAFALAPDDRDVLAELGDFAIRTGGSRKFAEAVVAALAALPTGTELWLDLTMARARVLATDPEASDDAASAFRAILDASPTGDGPLAHSTSFVEAAEDLALLLRRMPPGPGRTDDVRRLHSWRVDHAPEGGRSRALLAWAEAEEHELGDPAQALTLYRRVIEADPDDLEAWSAVSRLSLAQGDVEGALTALEARRAASEGDARNGLDVQIAQILADSRRGVEALDRIARVLDVAPQDAGALELAARLLADPASSARAAEVLGQCLDAVEDPELRVQILWRLIGTVPADVLPPEVAKLRLGHYVRLIELLVELGKERDAFEAALRGAREMPREASLWDHAEAIARQLSSPDPLAALYESALRAPMSREDAMELGQRAVAFYEEWFEDGGSVVGILERLLEIDPQDGWAFDRLKLIFDAQERWDDLFALYDRAAASAERERRIELLEDAAQIAKDFANHSARAIGYLEQLLELRPGNTRLSAALERLYERHGCHRELIALLTMRLPQLGAYEAQMERARIASLWLSELGDASSALLVIEEIIGHLTEADLAPPPPARPSVPPPAPTVDVTDLLERVLAVAPATAEMRESVPPSEGPGRRDSYGPGAKRTLVRQRAAALLKDRYSAAGKESDLARVLEVELEAVKSVKERIRRHQQVASIYTQLGKDDAAIEHFVQLVLLEPEVVQHRNELAALAERVGRFERLADVLVTAADDCNDDALRVELVMHAGIVCAAKIGDIPRAIDLFFRILNSQAGVTDEALLSACRHVDPLLNREGRTSDRLDVLERLAILEGDPGVRWGVLGEAARLASEIGQDERAIWAWQGRLETAPTDGEALDGLVVLLDKAQRWRPLIDVLDRRSKQTDDRDREVRRSDRIRVARILAEKLDAADESMAAWKAIEETFGESDEGTRALAALYRGAARYAELAELLARAAVRVSDPTLKAEVLRELGDVQREQLDQAPAAIASYEASLAEDHQNEGARAGLRTLLRSEHRADVVRVLLDAYVRADDWRLVLDLTEHRLAAARDVTAQIAVLAEAARLSEERAEDPDSAFALTRRALLLDPSLERTVGELFRLADATRNHRSLADALRECVDAVPTAPWARGLRFRMAEVLETKLDELRAALDAYVHVASEDPKDLAATTAVIRVAARTMRWDAGARAFVMATRALEALDPTLVGALESAAQAGNGWDAITFAMGSLLENGGGLSPGLARDAEALIAAWHRDRRGDPEAAEAAFARALVFDPTNAGILAELAKLQRRGKGRPLVESLLRLSQATGGDLDLLSEAADVALANVGDRGFARSIFERLLKLAAERWLGATEPNITSGTPQGPESYVERATRELVRIFGDDGDHEKVVGLLVDTAHLPWSREQARALRHEAAWVALEKLHAADRATAIYLGLVGEDPHDAEAVRRLVGIYESQGNKLDLLALKRRLVESAPSLDARLSLRREVATLEDQLGEIPRAIAVLEENLSESARDDATVAQIVALFTREQRLQDLETLFASQAELAEKAGESKAAADLFANAAKVSESPLGDLPRAIAHLRRVVAIEARPQALDTLARLSSATQAHDDAAGYLDQLRELVVAPRRAEVTLRLADALVAAGRSDEAQARLESEVARDPEADRVRTRLVDFYRERQAYASLAELLTEGAQHAPDKATRFARLREAADLHRSKTGSPERAIPLLEQAADLSPDDNGVKLALADALGAATRYEEARTLLRALVEAFGARRPKERAPVHYHLARLDLALGDRARALVELDSATRIDPANPEILRALAELARDDGQLDRAERSYRALLTVLRRQESPSDDAPISRAEVLFELSRIANRQGESDRGREILESALELSIESVFEARRLEGALRKNADFVNLARALEARLARGVPSDIAEICGELGALYDAHLGRPQEAFVMCLRALELDPSNAAAHETAARLAIALGDLAGYEEHVRIAAMRAEAHDPELSGSLFARLAAIAETEKKDDHEAAKLYEKAVRALPRDRELLASLDRIYERLHDDAGQARVLGMRVALDADEGGASSDALYRLAQLRFRSGDVDAACDAFEQAFEGDPDENRAEELLKAASDAHPTATRIVDIYERLARAPGRERSLVDALVRRWALPTGTAEPMREAVEVAENAGDKELSEQLLRRFLEKEHDDRESRVWALAHLATLVEDKGEIREALLLKREAAELAEPDFARKLLFDVARIASGPLDDLPLASVIYEELHERDPQDREAWEPLMDVRRRTDAFDKLTALIAEVVGYVDDVQERSKLRLERIRVAMDKLRLSDEDAASELRDIVDEDPTSVDAAILLTTILERTGREEDLVELLSRQLDAAKDRQDADAVSSLSRRLGQLQETRNPAEARDVYYGALDWDPKAREILLALERLHESDGDNEARADVMERRLAVEEGDEAERLALDLSALRRALDDNDAALRALEAGFNAAPRSATLRDKLEAVYKEQLEYEKLAQLYLTEARGRADAKARAQRLRDVARIYREEMSDPERGASVLREATVADPGDAALRNELIDMLVAAGELVNAEAELSRAVDAESNAEAKLALVGRRAILRARLNDGTGALADFEEAVEGGLLDLRANYVEHLAKMAMLAAGRGDAAEWRGHRLRIAQLRVAMGEVDEARNVLTELLKTDSRDKETLRAIANVDELEERWDAASATYRRLVGLEQGDGIVSAALKLAEMCEKSGRLADARGGLERARMAAPDNDELRKRLAWLYEQLGALKELAELVLEEARASGDVAGRFEGLVRAGHLFLEQAQDPQSTAQIGASSAVAPLEEAHALRPSDLDCAALLSDAYVAAGRIDEANDLLTRTIGTFKGRRARELSALYHRLGRIAEICGDRAAELQHLTTALDMDSQNGIVASELAYLAMDVGNWEIAQRALRQVTMLKVAAPLPKALAYQHLGEIARQQGDVKRAMMLLKRAIDDDPTLQSARALLDALQAEG